MEEQHSLERYGIVWYFYHQGPPNPNIQATIRSNYLQLGIYVKHAILSTPQQIAEITKTSLWTRTSLTKIAIPNFRSQKWKLYQQLQHQQVIKDPIVLHNKQERHEKLKMIDQILEKQNEIQRFHYSSQNQFLECLQSSFIQMKTFKQRQYLSQNFMNISKNEWKLYESYVLRFFASKSDQYLTRQLFQKEFSKCFSVTDDLIKQPELSSLDNYKKNASLRFYLKAHMKNMHQSSNCQKIGYPIRKICPEIKNIYMEQQQYKEREVVGWKLIQISNEQAAKLQPNQLYLHKTIEAYNTSLKQLLKNDQINPQLTNKMALLRINFTNKEPSLQEQFPQFKYGFLLSEENTVTINCMNILKLRDIHKRNILNFVNDHRIFLQNQQCFLGQEIIIIQFELISYDSIIGAKMPQWPTKLFVYLMNLLQRKTFSPKLQEAYIQHDDFKTAKDILLNKKNKGINIDKKLWKIIGSEQLLYTQITQHSPLQKIRQVLQLYKDLEIQSQYLNCLKIYKNKTLQSTNLFEKYGQRGQTLIQISLLLGLNLKNTQDCVSYLNQVVKIFDELIPWLNHKHPDLIKMQKDTQEQQQQQSSCIDMIFCKKPKKKIIRHKKPFDQILRELYFPDDSLDKQKEKLLKLKRIVCSLWKSLNKAVTQIYRYGQRNNALLNLRQQLTKYQKKKDIKQIEQSIKQANQYDKKSASQILKYRCEVLSNKYEQISMINQFPIQIENSSMQSSGIIKYKGQNSEIINWQSTNLSLTPIKKYVQSQSQIIQQQFSLFETLVIGKQQKALEDYMRICLSRLREDHNSKCSVDFVKYYKRRMWLDYKVGDITGLEMLTQIKFQKQRDNVIAFLAQLYQKISLLSFQQQNFEKCLKNINIAINWFKKIENQIPSKTIYNLQLLQLHAKVRLLAVISTQLKQRKQEFHQNLQQLAKEIKTFVGKLKEQIGDDKAKIYEIQATLIEQQLKGIVKQPRSFEQQKIKYLEKIKQRLQQFYQYSLKLARISINILMLYYNSKKLKKSLNSPFSKHLQDIENIFKQGQEHQQSEQQFKKFQWIKNLNLFFKQYANQLKYIQLLPARKYIERCLTDFSELKDKKLMTFELRKYYKTVYEIYEKFMKDQFKHFPKKLDMFQQGQKGPIVQQPDIKDLIFQSIIQHDYSHFNKIYWIIFVNSIIDDQSSKINLFYNFQYSPFVLTLEELQKKIIQIEQNTRCNQQKFSSIKPNMKLAIDDNRAKQIIHKNETKLLKKIREIFIIINDDRSSCVSELNAFILKQNVGTKVTIIYNLSQTFKYICDDGNQYCQSIYMNTLFNLKPYTEKNYRFHAIVYSALSQQYFDEELERQQTPLKVLMSNFLFANPNLKNKKSLEQYIKSAIRLQQQRSQILSRLQKGSLQQLINIAYQIIGHYQDQTILYPFSNNTLRSLYFNLNFDERGLTKIIHPLYHSISILHEYQFKNNTELIGKRLILWRKADMSKFQFSIYQGLSKDKYYIEFYSFLSTSKSFNWVINKIRQAYDYNKNSFKNTLIFKIQLVITKEFLESPFNNGFCYLKQQRGEQEILFNLLNNFKVERIRSLNYEQIIKQNQKNIEENEIKRYLSPQFKHKLEHQPIRFIQLTMDDYKNIFKDDLDSKHSDYLFQQTQFAFQKKRKKYQQKRNGVLISKYSIIDAYKDLGQEDKAKDEISHRVQTLSSASPRTFTKLIRSQGESMILRAAQNCLKLGNIQQAKQYVLDYLPKFKESRNQLLNYHQKIKFQDDIFEMRLGLIRICFENFDLSHYEKQLINIQEQLKTIKPQNDIQILKKETKKVFMLIYNSIQCFQRHQMPKSFQHLQEALEKLDDIIKKIKQKQWSQIQLKEKEKIQCYCQEIIQKLKERATHNESLNKNIFKSDIKKIDDKLYNAMKIYYTTEQQTDDLESTAHCIEAAIYKIGSQQTDNFQLISETSQQIDTLQRATSEIYLQSNRTGGLLQFKQINRSNNHDLLRKLQIHKNQILHSSRQGMSNIINSYHQITQKLLKNQIDQLKQEGHQRKSLQLIQIYNKRAKERMSKKINITELRTEIDQNIKFCKSENQYQKQLQQCQSILLLAQIYYLQAKDTLIQNAKSIDASQKKLLEAEKYLIQARNCLRNAYRLPFQQNDLWRNKFAISQTKQNKMYRLSSENLTLHVLELKLKHSRFTTHPQTKQLLIKSLQKLGTLVHEKRDTFDVLNEEIILNQFYCKYGLIMHKQFKFDRWSVPLVKALSLRAAFKGEINIQNAIDCLQLFQMLQTGLTAYVKDKTIVDVLYGYIEKGARSVENNNLFWRFVICKFNMINKLRNQSFNEFALRKLTYLEEVFIFLHNYKKIRQKRMVVKIYQTFIRFERYIKEMIIKKAVILSDQIQNKKNHIKKMYSQIVKKIDKILKQQEQIKRQLQARRIEQEKKIKDKQYKQKDQDNQSKQKSEKSEIQNLSNIPQNSKVTQVIAISSSRQQTARKEQASEQQKGQINDDSTSRLFNQPQQQNILDSIKMENLFQSQFPLKKQNQHQIVPVKPHCDNIQSLNQAFQGEQSDSSMQIKLRSSQQRKGKRRNNIKSQPRQQQNNGSSETSNLARKLQVQQL